MVDDRIRKELTSEMFNNLLNDLHGLLYSILTICDRGRIITPLSIDEEVRDLGIQVQL